MTNVFECDDFFPVVTKCNICLCIDLSKNAETIINELNEGIKVFYDTLEADGDAKYRCEIAVVTYNDEAKLVQDYSLVDDIELSQLENVHGKSNLSMGIDLSLNTWLKRRELYRREGLEYYRPWFVIISNGLPINDSDDSKNRIKKLEDEKRAVTFLFSTDNNKEELKILDSYSVNHRVMRINYGRVVSFFTWLAKSAIAFVNSYPNVSVTLPHPEDGTFILKED